MKSGADPGAEKEKEKEKEKNEDEESPEKPSKVRSGQATESKLASDGVTTDWQFGKYEQLLEDWLQIGHSRWLEISGRELR